MKKIYTLLLFFYLPACTIEGTGRKPRKQTRAPATNISQAAAAASSSSSSSAANHLVQAVESQVKGNVVTALKTHKPTRDLRNSFGNPILFGPASIGRKDIVELLLDEGAFVDEENAHGDTALMIAALRGHANVVQLLLAHGADPSHQNKSGLKARDYAAQKGCFQVCEILEKHYQKKVESLPVPPTPQAPANGDACVIA